MGNSTFNIATFDGGGLKGALSICLFEKLQKEFPNITKDINMYGGTSTGSFIALGLAYGVSPTKIKELYSLENVKHIFEKSYSEILRPKYNNDNLREVLLSIFPENLRLKDLGKLVVIPTFYIGSETSEWRAIFYNNMPNSSTENARVIDVAMASSAAPVFFPTYQNHIDGGIIATDPSLSCIVYSFGKELDKKASQMRLLSVGTGYVHNSIKEDTTTWGVMDWLVKKPPSFPIISVTLEGNCQMSQIFSKKLLEDNFYRLNARMDRDVAIDDCDSLTYLLSVGENYNTDDVVRWMKEKWN
ncbi:MAG: patatin-like phospholipase family protein [Romboutsia sp.]